MIIKNIINDLKATAETVFHAHGKTYKIVETRDFVNNWQHYTGKYRLVIAGDLFNHTSAPLSTIKSWLSSIKKGVELPDYDREMN